MPLFASFLFLGGVGGSPSPLTTDCAAANVSQLFEDFGLDLVYELFATSDIHIEQLAGSALATMCEEGQFVFLFFKPSF